MGLKQMIQQRKQVLSHLMTSLEAWRQSDRIMGVDLLEEEKDLMHAYDLLQNLIGSAQKKPTPDTY